MGNADDDPSAYEQAHVHSVYDAIAPHFSSTRHSPWPLVSRFLLSLPRGSVGLDIGCGNGKYLDVNPAVHIIGSDRSPNLIRLARERVAGANSRAQAQTGAQAGKGEATADVLVADGLALPFRPRSVDFIICIAVIHHLSTPQRRRDAAAALLRCARPNARVLLYAWALEQSSSSRRSWDTQDALVPWVMRPEKRSGAQPITYQRYYHLYKRGELEEDVVAAGGVVLESGYEKDNWWVICRPSNESDS